MNWTFRAVLYVVRKWQKTLLVSCLLLAILTLVLAGFAVADASEEQAEEIRAATGASFTVSRNLATGGWNSYGGGSYSTQEYLSADDLKRIAETDGIQGYNASLRTILCLSDRRGEWLEQMNPTGYAAADCQFYSYGCINSAYHSLFLSGALALCDGVPIDPSSPNGIVLSKDIADKHGLAVGDTIQAVNDPLSDDVTVDLEIVGLFEVMADKTDERNNFDETSYYDYTNHAFVSETAMKTLLGNYDGIGYSTADFFVSDPGQLQEIIDDVTSIDTINWDNFLVTVNDEVYQNIAGSLSDTESLITTLILVITAAGMILLTLILFMSVRSRRREIGILLAVGVAKPSVILQHILEVLLIAAAVCPIAYLVSRQAAGPLQTLFGSGAEHVVVTQEHFVLVAAGCGILLTAAVLVSCIPVMLMKPKTILTQSE